MSHAATQDEEFTTDGAAPPLTPLLLNPLAIAHDFPRLTAPRTSIIASIGRSLHRASRCLILPFWSFSTAATRQPPPIPPSPSAWSERCPPPLLALTFSHLSLPCVLQCRSVCGAWRAVLEASSALAPLSFSASSLDLREERGWTTKAQFDVFQRIPYLAAVSPCSYWRQGFGVVPGEVTVTPQLPGVLAKLQAVLVLRHLRVLVLQALSELSDADLHAVSCQLPLLTVLSIRPAFHSCEGKLSPVGFGHLASLAHLHSLYVYWEADDDEEALLLCQDCERDATVQSHMQQMQFSILALLRCPSLRLLSLQRRETAETPAVWKKVLDSTLPPVHSSVDAAVETAGSLESLDLRLATLMSLPPTTALSSSPLFLSLRSLRALSFTSGIRDLRDARLHMRLEAALVQAVAQLPALQSLRLTLTFLPSADLPHLAALGSRLLSFSLARASLTWGDDGPVVRDCDDSWETWEASDFADLLRCLPLLAELQVAHLPFVTMASLPSIMAAVPGLHTLMVDGGALFDEAGMAALHALPLLVYCTVVDSHARPQYYQQVFDGYYWDTNGRWRLGTMTVAEEEVEEARLDRQLQETEVMPYSTRGSYSWLQSDDRQLRYLERLQRGEHVQQAAAMAERRVKMATVSATTVVDVAPFHRVYHLCRHWMDEDGWTLPLSCPVVTIVYTQ